VALRVLLADDEQLVRSGLRLILESEPDLEVVGEAGTGAEAVKMARDLNPDVILMDIQMPEVDGLEATRQIAALRGEDAPRVLILTTFELDEYVYDALRAGASGFMLKRAPAADLVAAVRVVASGDALLAPSVTRRLIDQFAKRPVAERRDASALSDLTDREREVLVLVAHGLSNAEVARELVLTEGTVKTHLKRIFMKLDVRDRTQAVIFAYDAGLVEPRRT